MSLTKESPAFARHMEEEMIRMDNLHDQYMDEKYWHDRNERELKTRIPSRFGDGKNIIANGTWAKPQGWIAIEMQTQKNRLSRVYLTPQDADILIRQINNSIQQLKTQ